MSATSTRIEAELPGTWQELEARVAQILRECGYAVEVQKNVQLAGRGDVNIDVWADDHASPPNVIAVECMNWATPIPQHEVHAFRMVVGESGANTGLVISAAGFQSGAVKAARYSNVRLLDWNDFQAMFVVRWFTQFMSPTIAQGTDALHEYTEPINSRIARKANALPDDRKQRLRVLTERYVPLASLNMRFRPTFLEWVPEGSEPPTLPLRSGTGSGLRGSVPDDVLDAAAMRPLMDALIANSKQATAEFDEVFRERA